MLQALGKRGPVSSWDPAVPLGAIIPPWTLGRQGIDTAELFI